MRFIYDVKIEVVLNRAEADLIYHHIKQHPETKYYAEKGQFAFSFVNFFGKDEEFVFKLDTRKIDICLTALEILCYGYDKVLRDSIVKKLYSWAHAIIKERNDIYKLRNTDERL